jgi:hypothetical protein
MIGSRFAGIIGSEGFRAALLPALWQDFAGIVLIQLVIPPAPDGPVVVGLLAQRQLALDVSDRAVAREA